MLGAALLGVVGWFGFDYVGGQSLSAQVIKFKVRLGHQGRGASGGTQGQGRHGHLHPARPRTSGDEVGREDFRFGEPANQVDKVVTVTHDRARDQPPMPGQLPVRLSRRRRPARPALTGATVLNRPTRPDLR